MDGRIVSRASCDLTLLLVGPALAVLGGFVLAVAVALWARPESRFARGVLQPWRRATTQLAMMRVLLPIVGSLFLGAGCYLTVSVVRCEAGL